MRLPVNLLFPTRPFSLSFIIIMMTFCLAFAGGAIAQSEPCDALESRLSATMEKVSKEDSRWIKKTLIPTLCIVPDSERWVATVDSVVTIMENNRISPSEGIRNYLQAVLALSDPEKQWRWQEYHSFLDPMWSKRKKRKITNKFLALSPGLIANNILFASGNYRWELDSAKWELAWLGDVPTLTFQSTNLSARNQSDHFTLLNTSGEWDLRDEDCAIGPSTITWEGTSFAPDQNYARLPSTSIDLKDDLMRVPSCIMHSELSKAPLMGSFVAKLESVKSTEAKTYPRFRCADEQVTLEDVFEQTTYIGGVQFKGSKILGIRNNEQLAQIKMLQADTTFMEFRGNQFLFSASGWSCSHAQLMVHYDGDTLSHPDVQCRYNKKRNQIAAYRQEEGLGQQPFIDTYHALDWDVPGILWDVNSTRVQIGSALDAGQEIAQFSSANYFEQSSFDAIQGIDPVNPVVEVYRFTKSVGRTRFMTEDFARHIRLSEVQARVMLMELANLGYVEINPETLYCKTTPKLREHILCKTGRKDYDVIRFNSSPVNGVNAEWSLLNGHLQINGIDVIRLSTAKDVILYPANGEIVVKKDRDFVFDGRIKAGNIEMAGDQLSFDYSDFTMDFNAIESVRLSVYSEDELNGQGFPRKHWINNRIEGVSGTLAIDYPTNRSGRRSEFHPEYPVFESTKTSFVYYDQFDLFEGAYQRDQFYYAVEPFQLEKLDNLTKANFQLDGTLVSAGILKDLKLPIKVMDDYFLGITTNSGAEGMGVYSEVATFTNDLRLDGKGLQGKGSIDFLTAHIESTSLTMLPDSIIGSAQVITNTPSDRRNTAGMDGINGAFVFRPSKEQLDLKTVQNAFDFYGKEARLSGIATVTKQGFSGMGTLALKEASLSSDSFDFKMRNATSASASFTLDANRSKITAFQTDDVQCDLDFEDRLGVFTPNSGETKIELPIQQYICFMDRFRWYMDEDEIDLLSNRMQEDLPLDFSNDRTISNFISAHPDQDSLHFLSSSATYRIGEDLLLCKGVLSLAVADSRILPDSGFLTIRADAKMDELVHAQIVSNATTKYHFLDSAFLNINGRFDFEGAGFYNYTSVDGKVSRILFEDIQVDDSLRTTGKGSLIARDGFLLGPAFAFAGDVKMVSSEPYLFFAGGVKMTKECSKMQRSWIAFESNVNPKSIAIPISDPPRDIDGDILAYGLMASSRPPFTVYASFLDPQGDESDLNMLKGAGQLRYVDERYVFSTLEKLESPNSNGTKIDIRPSTCDLKGSGRFELPLDFQLVEQSFVGSFEINSRGEYIFKGSYRMDVALDQDLFDRMALQIPSWEPAEPVNILETNYEQALQEWLGDKASQKLLNDLAMTGELRNIPKSMRNTIVLTGLEMKWDPDLEEFISTSEFTVASLGDSPVFQKIPAKLILSRSRSKDSFTVYLHGDEENWYFLKYSKPTLNCSSSDKVFLSQIADIKPKKREQKDKDGRRFTYNYMSKNTWRNNLVDDYRDFD